MDTDRKYIYVYTYTQACTCGPIFISVSYEFTPIPSFPFAQASFIVASLLSVAVLLFSDGEKVGSCYLSPRGVVNLLILPHIHTP